MTVFVRKQLETGPSPGETRNEVVDWSGCIEVEQIPGIASGRPILKGTRVHADAIIDIYREGDSARQIAEILDLSFRQVQAVLRYGLSNQRCEPETESALSWSACGEVEHIPGECGEVLLVKGSSVQVDTIIDNYELGLSANEIAEMFELNLAQVRAVIDFRFSE
jgi:uncharacterized protein (DUF433 family)